MKTIKGKNLIKKLKDFINIKKIYRELPLYLMVLPAIIIVAIYSYGSILGVSIAFQKFIPTNGLFGSEWIGLENFRNLSTMPNIFQVIGNTIYISLFKMIGGIVVPVTFALLLNEITKNGVKRVFQTLVYLPNFLSWIILSGIFIEILSPSSGILNMLLVKLGFESMFFLGDPKLFPNTMIITDIWKNFGFASVIYLAALSGIDQNLYEAAQIDGASRIRQSIHITMPGILSTIALMTVLSMANILNGGFDQIYNMYSPIVYSSGDIIDTFVFRLGIQNAQFALATAAGLFKSVVSLFFVLISYYMADKFVGYKIF